MSKLKDRLIILAMMIPIVVYALLFWPYLLWLAWGRIISLRKQVRGLDFDLRGSE